MTASLPTPVIDTVLTLQIAVAWAGERGDPPRLGWWRSDLASEYGGKALFQQLLPATWPWAVLEATREVARRTDAELRGRDHDPDRIVSLFRFGYEIDEQLDERLADLKLQGREPTEALPGLGELIPPLTDDVSLDVDFRAGDFATWLRNQCEATFDIKPTGRHIKGDQPADLDAAARTLAAGLLPFADAYPLPHYRLRP